MANQEQLDILKEGVETWNAWREENEGVLPDLRDAFLIGVDLTKANLTWADLTDANLIGANLTDAHLTDAHLTGTRFIRAILTRAILIRATLIEANLEGADLIGADLRRADFIGAYLIEANLTGAILTRAYLGFTSFGDTTLIETTGLDACDHYAPSNLDHRTLAKNPDLPEAFLRGCGLSDTDIEYAKLYQENLSTAQVTDIGYRIIELRTDPALQFYSCFLSFSSNDSDFTKRLHDDLQAAGVRCWFAPEDLKIGDRFRSKIDEAIRSHEKLLLILSKAAIDSGWVEYEVERAHSREMKSGKTVLFPVRVDDAILKVEATWADFIRQERHIGDFTDEARYDESFERLLRDLREGVR